ncbi:MAG: hypothetical protein RLZZ346_1243 [Cyanobacteriota bacterium]|jgi:hypothetical protein
MAAHKPARSLRMRIMATGLREDLSLDGPFAPWCR